jgi:ABC-type branched-subunit amino acid transport system substrate-binding protein
MKIETRAVLRPRRRMATAVIASATVVAVVTVAGCSSSSSTQATGSTQATSSAASSSTQAASSATSSGAQAGGTLSDASPVKIGVIYTNDNPLGDSPEIVNAAEAAQSYINAHGGMGGRPLQIQTCNEMNNPQADIQCATSFVNGGQISVVGLGGLWGENGLSVIEKAGIVNQTIAISGPEFSSSLAYPFNGELVTGGNAVAKYAAGQGDTSVACVFPDVASLQQGCVQYFADRAKAYGIKNVTLISIPPTATDLSQYVEQIAQSKAQLVYSDDSEPANIQMIQNAQQLGAKVTWALPGDSARPDFFSTLKGLANGTLFYADQKFPSDASTPDVALYNQVMKQYQPSALIDSTSVEVFSTLMTLKALADRIGGANMTKTGLVNALNNLQPLQEFMGPMLSGADHIPGYAHAYHTGAYVYESENGTYQAAGKGYYTY